MSAPDWRDLPSVKKFFEVRESLKHPTTPKTHEVLSDRLKELNEARELAINESTDFAALFKRARATIHSEAVIKNPIMVEKMQIYREMHSPRPRTSSSIRLKIPHYKVFGCERCGTDRVNYRQINRKKRRVLIKQHPWLTKGDLKRGLPFCMNCTNDWGSDVVMKKFTLEELREIKMRVNEK